MPRSEYYNLLKTQERQAHVDNIAGRLGIGDSSTPNTWGKVIDYCLRTVRFLDTSPYNNPNAGELLPSGKLELSKPEEINKNQPTQAGP